MRVAFATYACVVLAACIFDKSNYQGGGRIDQGGVAQEPSASSTATDQPTATTPPTTQADTGTPVIITDGGAG